MKVLLLTQRVPYPPNRGDRIRSFHLLRFLAARADVSLACTTEEPVSVATNRYLSSLCERVAICPTTSAGRATSAAWSLAVGRAATEGFFWSPRLADTLRQWSRHDRFDAVVCYCSSMYRYTRAEEFARVPIVVDLVDVDSQKWLDYADNTRGPARWLYRLEGRRVRQLERELIERSRAVTVVSTAEAGLLRELSADAPVHPVPNGVDLDYFAPAADDATTHGQRPQTDGRWDCVFVGALDYFANIEGISWFCREVWPQVCAQFPRARFVIVGRRPVSQVRRLAAQPGVEVVGDVPDVRPYLRQARLVVVPLRIARGIQNKVLEALAAAKPVVASPQAMQGLHVVAGEHVYQAETPAQWVSSISTLLTDETECSRLGAAGRAFVTERHRWQDCLRPLEPILGLTRTTAPAMLSPSLGERVHAH